MDKKTLRRQVRANIHKLDESYRRLSDEGIFKALIALPQYDRAKRIFTYFSIEGEVDTHKLIDSAMVGSKIVALPVVLGNGQMFFAEAKSELIAGDFYAIPEPDRNSERIEPEPGDIIIVPALCFDEGCYRLGQGGGYYDRYLERHDDIFTVGLCRQHLLMHSVPREEHDRKVDCVITENEVLRT